MPAQSFHDHIKELRKRLLWVVLAVGVSAGFSYAFRGFVVNAIQKPLGATLFYTSPAGSFNFILKLSMLIGLFVALPVTVYQILRFIEPALPTDIKKLTMLKIILASFLLAIGGIAFSYFYMIPVSLHFFGSYSTNVIKPLISVNEYLSYVMSNFITFALVFQIPLLILFINWIKPIKPSKLLHYQRHVVVGAAALSVILPFTYDPISQFIVAIPIVVLYYVSVILLLIVNRKRVYPVEVSNEEPEIKSSPVPVFTEMPTQSTPTHTKRPALAIDGFVARNRAINRPVAKALPRTAPKVINRAPASPTVSRPDLSIDGISPSLSA